MDIYQLHETGELTLYASFPELSGYGKLEIFDFAPSGRLWFSTNNARIFRVADDGTPEWVANANPGTVINSAGILYALGWPYDNVQRITPDGQVTVIAEGFGQAHNIAIGPNDEILIVEPVRGELLEVYEDGTWRMITDGLAFDHSVAVAPDGTVYLLDWTGLDVIDLATGTKTPVDWYDPYANTGERGVFDSAGRLYTFHGGQPIYRVNLQAQTSEVILHPRNNTSAMSVGPDSRIFVAHGGEIPSTTSTLYEVTDDGTLVEIATVPYRLARAIAFGPNGTGFFAAGGPQDAPYGDPTFWGGMIYSFMATGSLDFTGGRRISSTCL